MTPVFDLKQRVWDLAHAGGSHNDVANLGTLVRAIERNEEDSVTFTEVDQSFIDEVTSHGYEVSVTEYVDLRKQKKLKAVVTIR